MYYLIKLLFVATLFFLCFLIEISKDMKVNTDIWKSGIYSWVNQSTVSSNITLLVKVSKGKVTEQLVGMSVADTIG